MPDKISGPPPRFHSPGPQAGWRAKNRVKIITTLWGCQVDSACDWREPAPLAGKPPRSGAAPEQARCAAPDKPRCAAPERVGAGLKPAPTGARSEAPPRSSAAPDKPGCAAPEHVGAGLKPALRSSGAPDKPGCAAPERVGAGLKPAPRQQRSARQTRTGAGARAGARPPGCPLPRVFNDIIPKHAGAVVVAAPDH